MPPPCQGLACVGVPMLAAEADGTWRPSCGHRSGRRQSAAAVAAGAGEQRAGRHLGPEAVHLSNRLNHIIFTVQALISNTKEDAY